jgi:hypothetical protein
MARRKPPAAQRPRFFGRFSHLTRSLACLRARGACGKNRPPAAAVSGRFSILSRACCRSSVVEHSLGKGEVHSSILCGSTSESKQNQGLAGNALPCPPRLEREQDANFPGKLGENPGTLFSARSSLAAVAAKVVAA